MKYERFPFNKYLCYINITSTDLNANIVKFTTTPAPTWHYNKSDFNKTRHFGVKIIPLAEYENLTMYKNKPWSLTGVIIELIRRRTEYVYNYMSPSALWVVASWAIFIIPPGNVNARVAIFITMILILVTIFNGLVEKLQLQSVV